MTPRFSILVPTYNQAAYLGQALDSLLAQTLDNWEAVVVDDGSTDETPSVLAGYAARDARIRPIHQENQGTAAALNTALANARGEWICWLSSDDMFAPDKLATHEHWFALHPDARFFFTYFQLKIEATGQFFARHRLWGDLPQRRFQTLGLFDRNFISGISICVHHDVFRELGPFSQELRYGQDYDRWLWVTSRYPGVFIPEWTCINRNHAAQGSEVFPQACYYDTAKAAIRFLASNDYEQLFPLCDLTRADEAIDALSASLIIALKADAFLYWLGATPVLFFSMAHWVAGVADASLRHGLWGLLEERLGTSLAVSQGASFDLMRTAMLLAARCRVAKVDGSGITPAAAGRQKFHDMAASGDPQTQALQRYFDEFMEEPPPPAADSLAGRKVAICCKARQSKEAATAVHALAQAGAGVLVACEGESSLAFRDGVYFLNAATDDLVEAARDIPLFDHCFLLSDDATPLPAKGVSQLQSEDVENVKGTLYEIVRAYAPQSSPPEPLPPGLCRRGLRKVKRLSLQLANKAGKIWK